MPETKQRNERPGKTAQLSQLAETLCLEIEPEKLAALALQLNSLQELEENELQDHPPILRMDAGWHD